MSDALYRSIAVASTFSPRFLRVISEAKRVRDRFDSRLSLIYVGERDAETARKFSDALTQLELPADSPVHYQQGDDPAEAILEAARANDVDLIIAGALEKEVILRPFLGDVARRLVRDAACSVMLFTKPKHPPNTLRHIVLIADFSEHGQRALRRTLHLASRESSEKLFVIRVYTTFDAARAALHANPEDGDEHPPARSLAEEEEALEKFILAAGHTDVPIEARCVRGNTGYAASDFVQAVEADLLAVALPPGQRRATALPAHIAWVTDVIPCNLWVIR
jgi:nucleotide-binding universal stress UspA family protein